MVAARSPSAMLLINATGDDWNCLIRPQAGMSMAVLTPSPSGLGFALDPHPHPAGVWKRYAAGLTTGRASARGGCLAYQPDQSDRGCGHGDHNSVKASTDQPEAPVRTVLSKPIAHPDVLTVTSSDVGKRPSGKSWKSTSSRVTRAVSCVDDGSSAGAHSPTPRPSMVWIALSSGVGSR